MDTKEIWNEFSKDLLKFIQRRVNSRFDAEDILQDVFRKIHDSIDGMKDENKVRAWVYQIARNAVTDYYRYSSKKQQSEAPLEDDYDIALENEAADNLNQDVSRWLRCVIDDMDEKYREAITLTEFDGLTQKELAEKLGLSLSGAKSRVQRGREKLKEALLACCLLEIDRRGNVIDYQMKASSCSCNAC
jgi:RNA polymerase sigma-70 factor, ECF subfamily